MAASLSPIRSNWSANLHLQIPVVRVQAERLFIFPNRFFVTAEQLQQMCEARADSLLLRLCI